jgi:uncharacterized RDD family membrane protein YckC
LFSHEKEIIDLDPIEKLTIETPEQIALEFPLAGLGSRGMAVLVDTLIQAVTALVVVVILLLIRNDLSLYWASAEKWMVAAVIFIVFTIYWGYFAIFEAFWNGQTPGKRQAKIRVISSSGRPITVFESIARNFMRAIDLQLGYVVGAVAIAIDSKSRRLGDMVAGTVVVHEIQEQGDSYWYAQQRMPITSASAEAMRNLKEEEFQLIETFLNRRLDLSNLQRMQSANEIAKRIGVTLNAPAEDLVKAEDFLEEVSRRYREVARLR